MSERNVGTARKSQPESDSRFTVGAVARETGMSADTVRWYLRQKLLRPTRNSRNGYYEFTSSDLAKLTFIRRAKALGFTIKEIACILEMSGKRQTPCPIVRDIVARRLIEFATDVEELLAMQRHMKKAISLWRNMPDGAPHGDEICRLIEATGRTKGVDRGVARRLTIKTDSAPSECAPHHGKRSRS